MKRNLLMLFCLSCLAGFTLGCYSTVDGRVKMGMPAALAKDTIEGRYERSVDEIFAAARKVLELNGTLYGENTIIHTLEAKIDNRTVRVAVNEVEPKTTRVRVQARRKTGTADIELASEIEKQIALSLPR